MRAVLLAVVLMGCLDMDKVDQAAQDEAGDLVDAIHVVCEDRWFGEAPCRVYRQHWAPVDLCCTEDACRVARDCS